jgi:hypothetical protein
VAPLDLGDFAPRLDDGGDWLPVREGLSPGERVVVDGAIINDMRRGGVFQDPPGYTQYPWVGLEGLVPAAYVLHRQGYPAFEAGDRAIQRSLDYLLDLRNRTGETRWFDGRRASEVIHLANSMYRASFPVADRPAGAGRTIGFTDWTHTAPDHSA